MIDIEVWLYGPLARYAGDQCATGGRQAGYAQLRLAIPERTTMRDLLARLGVPLAEKAITFVNGQLTDMPGLGADLELELHAGDRVGLFHDRSMWPFQYRFGASISSALKQAMLDQEGGAIRHTPS